MNHKPIPLVRPNNFKNNVDTVKYLDIKIENGYNPLENMVEMLGNG